MGTVKFYNDQKGFGFIQPDSGDKDVFVHATALERAGINGLREGQKVKFDTKTDPRRQARRRHDRDRVNLPPPPSDQEPSLATGRRLLCNRG